MPCPFPVLFPWIPPALLAEVLSSRALPPLQPHLSLLAGLHSHALGLSWGPLGGRKTPAKPRSRHEQEGQGEAIMLTGVKMGGKGGQGAETRKAQEAG